ncbi:MAG: hypothetical protein AB7O21_00435 [Gammaproteobacteria bacterium]
MHTGPAPASARFGRMTLLRRLAGMLLAGFSLAGAAAPALPPHEYAIFSALLSHGLSPEARQAVIADTTTGDPARIVSGRATEARAQELHTTTELLREWTRLNQRTFELAHEFVLPLPYALFSEADRDLLFRGDEPVAGWLSFFERYPGSDGVIRLSRAALDRTGTHALVYLELECGPECGSGRLVHLQRGEDAAWGVEGGELIWIAGPTAGAP